MQQYLKPTFYLDYDADNVAEFARATCAGSITPVEKAIALYYGVRDQIKYDPYDLQYSRNAMKASTVLLKGSGYCVAKAILLAAAGRSQGIPCRLGFADVVNHLSSPKLRQKMKSDLFVYHGYTELYLNNRWLKATPAFNLSLCTRFQVKPLEFDGIRDSIFHEFDSKGQKHMEYVNDHGTFDDVPFELLFSTYRKTYPNFLENFGGGKQSKFEEEIELKNRQI